MTKHNIQITKRIPFNAINSPLFHKVVIEAGVLLTAITVFLYGTYTLSAGSASGTAIGENPGALVQRFDVDAVARNQNYPGGKLKSVVPRGVLRRMEFDNGHTFPDLSLGASGVPGTAVASTVKTQFDLLFSLPFLADPQMTALRLDRYKQLMLKITNGGRDTLWTGNDRTQDVSALYYDILEYREAAGSDLSYQPPVVLYEEDVNIPINQANKKLSLDNQLQSSEAYLDILWIAETTNNALSNAILNEVFLKTGSEQFLDLKNDDIQNIQRRFITDAADLPATGLYYTRIARDLGNELSQIQGAVADLGATLDVSKPGTDAVWMCSRRVAPTPA